MSLVRLNDVSVVFDDTPVLREAFFRLEPGDRVGLIGKNGSGKSTMMNLLARFYDVGGGAITVDSHDLRDVTLASLRSVIGIVQQDVFLFSATVRDNIAYGKEDATIDEVMAAAKTAQLHDEIMDMAEGYETLIGERGTTLSGGQRQRLSIARTLILDPPILVLDDSTASVDAGTESSIQQAMGEVVKGRTTFIIAHRLSSIQHAQRIVVLEGGKIAELGTPHELMATGGLFTHLTELQYATNLNGHQAPSPVRPARGVRS